MIITRIMSAITIAILLSGCTFYSEGPLIDRSLSTLPFGEKVTIQQEGQVAATVLTAVDGAYQNYEENHHPTWLYEVSKLGPAFSSLLKSNINYVIEVTEKDGPSIYAAARIENNTVSIVVPRPKDDLIKKVTEMGGSVTLKKVGNSETYFIDTQETLALLIDLAAIDPETTSEPDLKILN